MQLVKSYWEGWSVKIEVFAMIIASGEGRRLIFFQQKERNQQFF
jgi:hypothetical protein